MILKPGREAEAEAIFRKWELDFAVIGHDHRHRPHDRHAQGRRSKPTCRSTTLANSAPALRAPVGAAPRRRKPILPEWVPAPNAILGTLKTMMGRPAALLAPLDLGAVRPHGDGRHRAAPRRRRRRRARARHAARASPLTCDVHPALRRSPIRSMGTKQAVVETWRNLIAVGADPLAITDNMNFGNPERPEIMGQFVGAVQGMAEACRGARLPGRVRQRLALQRDQRRRHPADARHRRRRARSPTLRSMADIALKREGDLLVVIGREAGHLGQSLYQLHRHRQARGRAAAGRPRRRDQGRQPRARADPRGQGRGRARRQRRRPAGRHRRDGAGRRHRRRSSSPTRASCPRMPPGSARTRAAMCSPLEPERRRGGHRARAPARRCPRASSARVGGDALDLKGEAALPLAELRTAHEAWLPQLMG